MNLRQERGLSALELFVVVAVIGLILLVAFQASKVFVEYQNNTTAASKIGSAANSQSAMESVSINSKVPGNFIAVPIGADGTDASNVASITGALAATTFAANTAGADKYQVIVATPKDTVSQTGTVVKSDATAADLFADIYGEDQIARGTDPVYVAYPHSAKADLNGFRKVAEGVSLGTNGVTGGYDIFKIVGR